MMAALPDIITLVYGFFSVVPVVENAIMPGTKAVRWELFENLDLSWNDVSAFCHSQDGHIATPNTRLALNGLGQQAAQWFSPWGSRPLAEFWIGLHSAMAGAHPNVWEKDCSLQDGNIQLWAAGEPNFKDTDLCIRVYPGDAKGQLVWKTWKCSREFAVVCEYEQGNCTYDALPDKTLTSEANATARGYVNDVTTCWDLCLELRVGDQECVAAVFNGLHGDCEMFLGDQILEESSAAVSDDPGCTVLLRRCFSGSTNTQTRSWSGVSSTSNTPHPANETCSDQFQEPQYEDYVPPGVRLISDVDTASTAASSSTTQTSTVSVATTISSSVFLSTAESSVVHQASSSSASLTALSSMSVAASASVPLSTSSSVSPTASSYVPLSTSSFVSPTALSSVPLSTSSSVSPTASSYVTPTAAAAFTQTIASSVSQSTVSSTTLSTLYEKQSTADFVSTPSLEQTSNTVTEEMANTTVPSYNTPTPGTTTKRLCACACRGNSSLPSHENETINLEVISTNETSKYRRSKTSAYVDRPINTGMGIAFVIGSFSFVFGIMLCDLSRIQKCQKSKTKVRTISVKALPE